MTMRIMIMLMMMMTIIIIIIIIIIIKRAQVPAVKEPLNLMRQDGKRPDRTTFLPWAKGKLVTCDVTVADTYAESRLPATTLTAAAAAADTSSFLSDFRHNEPDGG